MQEIKAAVQRITGVDDDDDPTQVLNTIRVNLHTLPRDEAIKLLDKVVPPEFGLNRVRKTFLVSKRMAMAVKKSMAGEDCSKKPSRPISQETKDLVRQFYYREDISKVMPGKLIMNI